MKAGIVRKSTLIAENRWDPNHYLSSHEEEANLNRALERTIQAKRAVEIATDALNRVNVRLLSFKRRGQVKEIL